MVPHQMLLFLGQGDDLSCLQMTLHNDTIAFIVVLGNKIVITILKWNGSHNEGANLESFIS
jgi:hypothetical protein